MNLTKLIPFSFQVKSLYWVRQSKAIDKDLTRLFELIDCDFYIEAKILLAHLKIRWEHLEEKVPFWFHKDYVAQLVKAEAMLHFLTDED